MSHRIDKYAKISHLQDMENLSSKLTADLRKCIRTLGSYPVLSEPWCHMAENVWRIARVTEMEKKLPKSNEDATLWECEEVALRYMLEDGKINLSLRCLVDYKNHKKHNQAVIFNEKDEIFMEKFEVGLGLILKQAWFHIESIQTTDIPTLIEYIANVLHEGIRNSGGNATKESLHNRQEILVIYYLYGLSKRMEDIGETRIMPLILAKNVLVLLIQYLQQIQHCLKQEDILTGCRVLSMLCDTEDFQTHKDDYIQPDDEKDIISLIHDVHIEPLIKDSDNRRQLRPLLDFAAKCERSVKTKK